LKVLIHAYVNVLASLFAVIFTVDLRKSQQLIREVSKYRRNS